MQQTRKERGNGKDNQYLSWKQIICADLKLIAVDLLSTKFSIPYPQSQLQLHEQTQNNNLCSSPITIMMPHFEPQMPPI
jgi:hypothetical protein